MLIVFTACSFCLLLYWVFYATAMSSVRQNIIVPPMKWPGVSVILCFKNEQSHLLTTLTSILSQEYPEFEVVAMDDFSTDQSKAVVLGVQDRRIRYVHATQDAPGKKAALAEAIRQARFPLCLLTDADCQPASGRWIQSMVASLLKKPGTEIVLGVAPTNTAPGILNLFQRYETNLTAIQYISYAWAGIPYMGVGRNLLYFRNLFLENGFDGIPGSVISGDDDLFVHHAATRQNTAINTDPDAFVTSPGKSNLFDFLRQKSRHISTSVYYSPLHKLLLGAFPLVQLAWFVTLTFLVLTGTLTLNQAGLALLLKWTIQVSLLIPAAHVLKSRQILVFFPVLDLCMMAYYIVLPWTLLSPKKQW